MQLCSTDRDLVTRGCEPLRHNAQDQRLCLRNDWTLVVVRLTLGRTTDTNDCVVYEEGPGDATDPEDIR